MPRHSAFLTLMLLPVLATSLSPYPAVAKTEHRSNQQKPQHPFVFKSYDDIVANGPPRSILDERVKISEHPPEVGPSWRQWSDSLFAEAKRDHKFVLLDLEAVWCHWCHVMDQRTYSDPEVRKLLATRFITVKVDQDSRPDLSHKYEEYGWPATIIFAADGTEIVKRTGYIRPERMIRLLKAIIKDPSPEETTKKVEYGTASFLSQELKKELEKKHADGFDTKYGAWGTYNKFLDWDSVEYAMMRGIDGDKEAAGRARKTLEGQLNLLDPVWGGVYQYSTDGDWDHPHFEKIMQMQAENLRIYALGHMIYGDKKYLSAARSIASYLHDFLTSPAGAFYTSQDADLVKGKHSGDYFSLNDEKRRQLGIPRVDRHIYSRENGWAATGLVTLYMATGESQYLDWARKSVDWIESNRSIESGGFRHDSKDVAGPYLGDSLAMARTYLALYEATAERKWLDKACRTADFIDKTFTTSGDKSKAAGYVTARADSATIVAPEPLLDENVTLSRFCNLLSHYSGKKKYRTMALNAMRYLATPQIARQRRILVAGILLADSQLASEPAHVTVVGAKKDNSARALFLAALKSPVVYRRIEWYDRSEGRLANMDVEYPTLKRAAAFFCGSGSCSSPAYEPIAVRRLFDRARM